MPRKPDTRIEKAKELFLQGLKLVDISDQLNVPEGTVRSWKNRGKWDKDSNATLQKKECNVAKHKGAQSGNKNALGHGAPPKNNNAEKHGLFRKYLPEETFSIIEEMPADPLDILWDQIRIAYAAIIRAQQIMYVTDKNDKTIERVAEQNGNVIGEKWEVQQAWDKQANFLKSQARAQGELRSMIKQYDELLHKNWDLATKEQKARISAMKAKAKILRAKADADNNTVIADDGFLDALNGTASEDWADENTTDI